MREVIYVFIDKSHLIPVSKPEHCLNQLVCAKKGSVWYIGKIIAVTEYFLWAIVWLQFFKLSSLEKKDVIHLLEISKNIKPIIASYSDFVKTETYQKYAPTYITFENDLIFIIPMWVRI